MHFTLDDDDDYGQFNFDAYPFFPAGAFVDQTVPCDRDAPPTSSPGDSSCSPNANYDDAMTPASAETFPGYFSSLDDPGPGWRDCDPDLIEDAQAASPNFFTFGAFPGAGPPTDLLPPGGTIDSCYDLLAGLDDTQLQDLMQGISEETPDSEPVLANIGPSATRQSTLAAPSLDHYFNTYVAFPEDLSTSLPPPGEDTTPHNDVVRAGSARLSSLLPIQGIGDWTIQEPQAVNAALVPTQKDYAGPRGFAPNPHRFPSPSGTLGMPLRPTVASPSDNFAFAEKEDEEAAYHPIAHRGPLLTPWTAGDTSTSSQSAPSANNTFSLTPGYPPPSPSLPSPAHAHDWSSPFGAPSNPPDAPIFTIVKIGARTYKTSQEYEGDRLVVWYYCSHNYPDCPKREQLTSSMCRHILIVLLYTGIRTRPGNLRDHQREAHDPTLTRSQCAQCACSFMRERDLQAHVRNRHK
ncbi:hypothetical protein TRAPUB_9170 [Trametes pubescens]|uniref:C2H2-type domain-containing protein n=1 Tax=Trametes pubescens TaxID=154538 RepID=A0A1M2W387_TRAPU|nr:hypothetical protein TRAPUB_9170 [Trametes pubescens]